MNEVYKHANGSIEITSAVCPKCGGTDWYGTGSWFIKIMCRKCDITMKCTFKKNRQNARFFYIVFGIMFALSVPFFIWIFILSY